MRFWTNQCVDRAIIDRAMRNQDRAIIDRAMRIRVHNQAIRMLQMWRVDALARRGEYVGVPNRPASAD